MASDSRSVFEEPQCLISSDSNNKLTVEEHVVDQLRGVKEQLNVVTIVGLYRTGKSYLLTRLANKYKGFPLGSTIQSKTKGIWAWCVKHPIHEDQMLLLLDTEGLGDIQKGNQNHDNQIFTLATVLSSTLIYNTLGAFDQDAVNKLNFITEISRYIKTSETTSGNIDADFDLYFPEIILSLRDFSLELVADDQTMTSDQYLEYCLNLQSGDSEEIIRFNEPKRCLRKYFKKRKCFVFERPVKSKLLKKLEELQDKDLDKDFVKDTETFTTYVHRMCEPLFLMTGRPVNGGMFVSLLTSFVDAVRNGAVPCIETALKSMAIIENEKAVKAAVIAYKTEMSGKLVMPTPDEKTLLDVHLQCKAVAFDIFKKQSVMDEGNKYKEKADADIETKFESYARQNDGESEKKCEDALKELYKLITDKIQRGVYAVAGGYKMYRADRTELEMKYFEIANLGLKRHDAYIVFTVLVQNEETSILKSDEMVTQKEKETETERQKTKQAQDHEKMYKIQYENMKVKTEKMHEQMIQERQALQEQNQKDLKKMAVKQEAIIGKRIDELRRLQEEKMLEFAEQEKEKLANALAAKDEANELQELKYTIRIDNLEKDKDTLDKLVDEVKKTNVQNEQSLNEYKNKLQQNEMNFETERKRLDDRIKEIEKKKTCGIQ